MKTRRSLALGAATLATFAAITPSAAAAPTRGSGSETGHAVWGACGGPDDLLVADYTVTERVTEFESGRATLHLTFVGAVTRTGTGLTGKYSERQRDFFSADGSERYVGTLGHLVVPGGKGFTFAGQAKLSSAGEFSSTPGLAPLLEIELDQDADARIIELFCDTLSRQ